MSSLLGVFESSIALWFDLSGSGHAGVLICHWNFTRFVVSELRGAMV